jgi:hypothetical protein
MRQHALRTNTTEHLQLLATNSEVNERRRAASYVHFPEQDSAIHIYKTQGLSGINESSIEANLLQNLRAYSIRGRLYGNVGLGRKWQAHLCPRGL